MVSWLLDHGADVNVRSYTDVTPVTFALETCPVDAVRELFRRADIDLTKGELLHAALSRHKGHILYPGVGPFYGNDKDRVPADDIVDVLKIVLEQDGIDKLINVKQYANHVPSYRMYFFMHLGPPIRLAAERGLTDAVRLLLVHGADPTIKDNKGQTPDFYAEKWGHAETAEVLRAAMKRASSYNAGKL